jgi:hypothetical protein
VVVKGGLFAAEHHKRIGMHGFGQRLARPWAVDVDQGGGFVQGDANLSVMRDAGIFNDGNAHVQAPDAGGRSLHGAGRAARGAFALAKHSDP